MEITRTATPSRNMAELDVCHCPGCGVVYLSIGEKVVSFDREAFAKLVETAVDIHYSGRGALSVEYSILDLAAMDRDDDHSIETLH